MSEINFWKLEGLDTFSDEPYLIDGQYTNEADAIRAAKAQLKALETTQPSEETGGQDEGGIQDRIFVIRPDGTKYRFRG
ncbi:MAG: hypothetical protein ACREGC_01915 [Minisyncoccia bacterium]